MKRFNVFMRKPGYASGEVLVAARPTDDPACAAAVGPLNRVSELVSEPAGSSAIATVLPEDEWVAVASNASDTEIADAGKVWHEMEQTGALPSSAQTLSGAAAKIISTASILAGNADSIQDIERNKPQLIEQSEDLANAAWAW